MPATRPVRIGADTVTTDEDLVVRSPFDGSEVGRVPRCDASHVERAVRAGVAALADPLAPWQRAEILDAAAHAMVRHRDELARTIAQEAAKPIRTARVEAERTVVTFQSAAVEARTLVGEVVPIDGASPGAGKLAFTLRVPRGVVAAISPFNFPLNLVVHKVAPAIAAGCPVVLKPASQTPLSAILLQEILMDECGLPPGWLSIVTGSGGAIGDPLVEHPDVAVITFTGSPDVGWAIAAKAADKHVGLELGNNAPVIIEPSGDWQAAAAKISVAGFSHAGQSCISTQRIYVHRSIADEFTSALVERVEDLVVGDPLDEATDVSSLISESETERVRAWIAEAVEAGAEVRCGGDLVDGVLAPTVLSGVTPEMEVCRSEVFGPLVGIIAYDELDDALAQANDTRYGLQAAVFTAELATALRAARELDFGGVLVNEVPTFRTDQMPYGGVRDSGNTKEGPHYAVREMTRERLVIIQS
ncbi:MAG: aldehyde dehydrogenase family protein [Acidimicrobiales bacterium]|nr:aldehyde dehydrogenase family protein [Acidimicrobiales bacterium]HRW38592.1 aldehyde dehydrogenase family protein [Aquihabitans sp.]